ncbi:DNA repair protein RecN [Dactylosporangium aurantiacum]|uniref:DNA repair protein RecN n=1 Tax=Dactylosporangium aurantiacum TaxID=35754 RepID=A0A9Q9IE20_9ACTN|nr:DNA repair protein RecN [Dactylosporangium aurantiacum]MDG6101337.1 DNA repair protein RecN [Dactylosporangium aurantiacum]UWZ52803.1 DNA repair protein RecN [Dactylosporangium aurantiacum]
MLEELRITGLGVIEDATLPLGPGLTVITGETGAGKTMVVTSLGLLFGGRADAGRVRADPGRATVDGRLTLPAHLRAAVESRIVDAGAEVDDDGTLLMSRTVTVEGRSRAHVGGRTVPVAVLGEVGERVFALHGQSDQLRLLRPAEQRAALDRYAGPEHEKLLGRFAELYSRWRAVEDDLADRRANARQRSQEADLLRLGLDEISRVDPQPGEDELLREEAQRLEHVEGLRSAAQLAHVSLTGTGDGGDDVADVLSLLSTARRTLEAQTGVDRVLGELAARLDEVATLAGDVSTELGSYLASLDADPGRLQEVYERRAALRALTRKYAEDVDGVVAWADRARAKLEQLDTSDELLEELDKERRRLHGEVAELAAALSAARQEAAGRFAADVTVELAGLAMPHARIHVVVAPKPAGGGPTVPTAGGAEAGVGPDGADDIELRLLPHPGAPAQPLQKGASGGELSRVMLAIEVVFAGVGGPPTLVFDEVDAGVGGTAAVEIGKRLARLARDHQVLVVTHLPQVAAFADRHLVVAKDTGGAVTTSGVRVVEHTDRARELARMLAGLPDSDLGIAHAEELLSVADREKSHP